MTCLVGRTQARKTFRDRKCKHPAEAPLTKTSHRGRSEMSQATQASLKITIPLLGGETARGHHIPDDLTPFHSSSTQISSSTRAQIPGEHFTVMTGQMRDLSDSVLLWK